MGGSIATLLAATEPSGDLTAPVATLIAAGVVLVVGLVTVGQKWRNDRRDAWWKRAQWAIDKSLSTDPKEQTIGLRSMEIFAGDPAVSDSDVRVLKVAAQRARVQLAKQRRAKVDSG